MKTKSTFCNPGRNQNLPLFSFISRCIVLALLFVGGIAQEGYAQSKVNATEMKFASEKVAENIFQVLPAQFTQETVENPSNATNALNTFARLNASPGLILNLGAFGGALELKYPGAKLPGGTTTFIKIKASDDLLSVLLGGSLGELLDNVVGAVALGAHVFDVEARNDEATPIFRTSSSNQFKDTNAKIITGIDGSYYLAITPDQEYNIIRISNKTTALLGLDVLSEPKTLDVFEAFYYPAIGSECTPALGTSFDASGISLSVLQSKEMHLERAIDEGLNSENTYSELKPGGLLDVNLLGSVSQFIYFPTTSSDSHTVNIKIGMTAVGGVANLDLLGALQVVAWDGAQEVYNKPLTGGLLNGLDVLTLLQNGSAATLTFAPGRAFDRIEIRLNSPVGLSLLGSSVKIYNVERYDGVSCVNPLIPVVSPTASPFEVASCSSKLGDFQNVDFATNATDGNNETFATLYANNGNLLTAAPLVSYIEMKLPEDLNAKRTSYVRIDMEDDILERLVNGSIGQVSRPMS